MNEIIEKLKSGEVIEDTDVDSFMIFIATLAKCPQKMYGRRHENALKILTSLPRPLYLKIANRFLDEASRGNNFWTKPAKSTVKILKDIDMLDQAFGAD